MGKIIRIKEDGLPRAFDAAKLRTNLQGGGNCLWIPKESVPVASKSITENGEYAASEEGIFGYSELMVNVYRSTIGRSRKNNAEYRVKTNYSNELTYDILPSHIKIETLPNKINYIDDQPIDITGIIVRAYDENYELWTNENYPNGVIPINELSFLPTEAKKSITPIEKRSSQTTGVTVLTSQLKFIIGKASYYTRRTASYLHATTIKEYNIEGIENIIAGATYRIVLIATRKLAEVGTIGAMLYTATDKVPTVAPYDDPYIYGNEKNARYDDRRTVTVYENDSTYQITSGRSRITYNGKTVYYSGPYFFGYYCIDQDYTGDEQKYERIEYATTYPVNDNYSEGSKEDDRSKMIWTAIYGDTIQEDEVELPITITWKRPMDDKELSDTYNIKVATIL